MNVGDKAAGVVRALYNPSLSERGVLLCAHRKPRPKDPFDFQVRPRPHKQSCYDFQVAVQSNCKVVTSSL